MAPGGEVFRVQPPNLKKVLKKRQMQLVRFYKTYQNPLGQLLNEFSKLNSTGGLSHHHYWRDGTQEINDFRDFLRISRQVFDISS